MQMFLRYVFCSYIWFIFGCVVVFESWVLMWPIGQSHFLIFIWFVSWVEVMFCMGVRYGIWEGIGV